VNLLLFLVKVLYYVVARFIGDHLKESIMNEKTIARGVFYENTKKYHSCTMYVVDLPGT